MDRQKKLDALRRIAMMMRAEGPLLVLFGFLAGVLDRLTFVRDLDGATAAVHLSLDSRIWPRLPFRGQIDGKPVPHPIAFVDMMAVRDDDLYVRVDFPLGTEPGWYRELCQDGVKDRRTRLEEAVAKVRQRIDLALDVYRTAKPMLESASDEERQQLQFVVQTAREEIQSLSRQLSELEAQLGQQSS